MARCRACIVEWSDGCMVWCVCVCVGKVVSGLHYTPCGRYVVYPLGSFIVLKNLVNEREAFFDGHSQDVSCIAMSHNGDRLASGQVNFTGVKVSVDGSDRAVRRDAVAVV